MYMYRYIYDTSRLLDCQFLSDKMASSKTLEEKYNIFNKCVSSGNQGTVFSGVRIADLKPIAVKFLNRFELCTCAVCNGQRPREVCFLEKCQGIAGVVEMYDFGIIGGRMAIFMEQPHKSKDLYDMLNSVGHFTEHVSKQFFGQLVRSTYIMHQIGVVHSDLKMENVLIDTEEMKAKIIDFGNAHSISYTPWKMVATAESRPPEQFVAQWQYNPEAVAVWCLGLILYEMVHGQFAFTDSNDVVTREVQISRRISLSLKELLCKMLSKHPCERPKLIDILHHRWVKETDL